MNESGLSRIEDKAKNATWEDDFFGRKPYADKLTQLVKNTKNPYVIALSAEWGNGKTFFLNAWRNSILPNIQRLGLPKNSAERLIEKKINNPYKYKLKENEIPCVYIDAWALEDLEDPLLAISYEIQEQLAVYFWNEDKTLLNSALDYVKIPSIVNIGTSFVKDLILDKFENTANSLSDILISSSRRLENNNDTRKNFYSQILSIVNGIKEKTQTNSILIMIDELDRCNPEYIINLLERIKILFNISGLVFVLAISDTMLDFAIRKKFDNNILIKNYLEKFINLYFFLPKVSYYNYVYYKFIKEYQLQDLCLDLDDEGKKFWLQDFEGIKKIEQHDDSLIKNFDFTDLNLNIIFQSLIVSFTRKNEITSIRNLEQRLNKFIVICLSNKLNMLELLLLLDFSYRRDISNYDCNLSRNKSNYNKFCFSFDDIFCYVLESDNDFEHNELSYQKNLVKTGLDNLDKLIGTSISKEENCFKKIFTGFSSELKVNDKKDYEQFYIEFYKIVQQLFKEKKGRNKAEIIKKVKQVVCFYDLTTKNDDNN